MNIALIAHDNKKDLMVQFCTAYCGILAHHTLCATAITGQQIATATGLTIHRFLTFHHGGGQQIAARIAYNEIDLVLCFNDPNNKVPHEDVLEIARLCLYVLMHWHALHGAPYKTSALNLLFPTHYLLHCPHLAIGDVMKCCYYSCGSCLSDITQTDRVVRTIPAEGLY